MNRTQIDNYCRSEATRFTAHAAVTSAAGIQLRVGIGSKLADELGV